MLYGSQVLADSMTRAREESTQRNGKDNIFLPPRCQRCAAHPVRTTPRRTPSTRKDQELPRKQGRIDGQDGEKKRGTRKVSRNMKKTEKGQWTKRALSSQNLKLADPEAQKGQLHIIQLLWGHGCFPAYL